MSKKQLAQYLTELQLSTKQDEQISPRGTKKMCNQPPNQPNKTPG